MASEHGSIVEWLRLIEAEYKEMPGLSLSKAQMRRFWGLEPYVCDALVDALVTARVLKQTTHDTYVVSGVRSELTRSSTPEFDPGGDCATC